MYEEITENRQLYWDRISQGAHVDFKNNEIVQIGRNSMEIFRYRRIICNGGIGIRIDKFEDEWFFVRRVSSGGSSFNYYRCDQLEGLLNCLENILVF